jgi:hypothetical protein
MPTFLYRCPNTGLRVQGWIADDPTKRAGDSFEAVSCPACRRVHLVNPKSGKVLGATTLAWRNGRCRFKIIPIARNRPATTAFGPHGPSISRHKFLNKEQEYRRNAAESMRLAVRMADPGDRRLLLALAERWLYLAEWRARLLRKKGVLMPEHPLVRKRLGPDQIGAE